MTANVHHIIVGFFSFYTFINPECGEESSPFQQFYDDLCFLTLQKKQVYLTLITLSYFTFDFLVLIIIIRGTEIRDITMYIHHLCCILTISGAMVHGYGLLVPGVLGINMELSSIIFNFRYLMTKE